MNQPQSNFFKEEKSVSKRRQRLTEEEAQLIHLMRNVRVKPQVDVNLPSAEPFIMTPRNKR
jgi:hypothetical protein